MKITIKQLKQLNACQDGIDWFNKQKNKEAKHILRQCLKDNHFDYANWFVAKLFTKPQAVMYIIFNAEQCIKNFEQTYPNDTRPRKAIEAAKQWLSDPTGQNESAAESAWSAAWSARSSAWSARSSAWSARSSAWSARSSAWSAAKSDAIEKAIQILGL